nr:excalibur calcium-binding domain-containing protein [Nocardia higoensis]
MLYDDLRRGRRRIDHHLERLRPGPGDRASRRTPAVESQRRQGRHRHRFAVEVEHHPGPAHHGEHPIEPQPPPDPAVVLAAPHRDLVIRLDDEGIVERGRDDGAARAQARAAGAAPLYAGSPGYRSGLDRDGDGRACE